MKTLQRFLTFSLLYLSALLTARAVGWPTNYPGVMLQGFFWDSYSDTKWSNLAAQADQLSASFDLIWVPNSGHCGGGNNMGYMPQYWFTNHNSAFGTEAELLSMIQTFKAKGTGIIADVVINHRNGVTNWTDFPAEQWNGTTWHLGPEHICCDDEVKNASGQATPTGNYDTGDNFDGARDLDHTNLTVQDNCKNYTKCLLEKYGYTGFRYDMVKGYNAQYIKTYNQYSRPTYSVGEYWDSSYDRVKAWIDGTGRESAAFDFPFKYAVNEAFATNDMTKLVWMANGTTPQPAGMIHHGYQQLAVTFVDNHDTYRDGSRFNGNILSANAFMLCSPGTPCVFLPHWKSHRTALANMIAVRKAVGVTNTSAVEVLRTDRTCYMARVQGTNGSLVVKIGSAMVTPQGYTDADIKCSGNGYCIWTKTPVVLDPAGGEDPGTPGTPGVCVYLKNTAGWATPTVWAWNGTTICCLNQQWPGDAMTRDGDLYRWSLPEGMTAPQSILFSNNGASQTTDLVFTNGATYDCSGAVIDTGGGTGTYPDKVYLVGNVNGKNWDIAEADIYTTKSNNGRYVWSNVTVDDAGTGTGYFSFNTVLGTDWDSEVNQADRYGALAKDTPVSPATVVPVMLYAAGVNASASQAWCAPAGSYDIVLNLKEMTLHLTAPGAGIDNVGISGINTVEYYTLTGTRVHGHPTPGIYIVRRGNAVSKEFVR